MFDASRKVFEFLMIKHVFKILLIHIDKTEKDPRPGLKNFQICLQVLSLLSYVLLWLSCIFLELCTN